MMPVTFAIAASILISSASPLRAQGPPPFHPKPSEVAQADLFVSLTSGNRAGVEAALRAGANPNEPDFIEQPPLFYAGDIPTIKLLVHHGANINVVTRKGSTLIAALLGGSDEAAKFYLTHGVSPTAPRSDKMTPLMAASVNGLVSTLKLLVAKGVNLNSVDREGSTALMYAVRGNQLKSAKILLNAGANVSAKDNHKRTALHYAAMRGCPDMVGLLTFHGASAGARDFNGETPLHLAAKYSGDPDTIGKLLHATTHPGIKDRQGRTAADVAARYGSPAVAKCFGRQCSTPMAVSRRNTSAVIRPAVLSVQQSVYTFVQKSGCVSCHHQGLGVMTLTQAAQRKFRVDKGVIGECFKQMEEDGKQDAAATHAAVQDAKYIKMLPAVHLGDQVYGGAYILGALRSAGVPSNPGFGEGVTIMGRLQMPDGRFTMSQRGTMEHSDQMTTGLALDVLKAYWPQDNNDEFNKIATRAKNWSLRAKATCAEDLAGQLLVLARAGGSPSEIDAAASHLLHAQRVDGGWGTKERQISDSYTTGVSLYALRTAAHVASNDSRLKRAVAFLVRTQEDDGSWYEPKVTPAYNNHFDSSFPHGYDQFASFAGTCWATLGLLSMMP